MHQKNSKRRCFTIRFGCALFLLGACTSHSDPVDGIRHEEQSTCSMYDGARTASNRTAGYCTYGRTKRTISLRAGRDFTPSNCSDCLQVREGKIRNSDGSVFVGLGYNAVARIMGNSWWSGANESDLMGGAFKIIRIYAADHTFSFGSDMEARKRAIIQAVDEIWSKSNHKARTMVALTDYYNGLPGEKRIRDNKLWCNGDEIYPWPWFRKGTRRFSFTSVCPDGVGTKTDMPNYEEIYRPFVVDLARRLKEHPGVFAWQLGSELRALGRYDMNGNDASDAFRKDVLEHYVVFVDDMIKAIRQEAGDGNHLITPGAQNMTEVTDMHAGDAIWEMAFDKMLEVDWNFWGLTYYNYNNDTTNDVRAFPAFSVPVIATEFGFCKDDPRLENSDDKIRSAFESGLKDTPTACSLLKDHHVSGLMAWEFANGATCGSYNIWGNYKDMAGRIDSRECYNGNALPLPASATGGGGGTGGEPPVYENPCAGSPEPDNRIATTTLNVRNSPAGEAISTIDSGKFSLEALDDNTVASYACFADGRCFFWRKLQDRDGWVAEGSGATVCVIADGTP